MNKLTFLLLFLISLPIFGQNTLSFDENTRSPKASIQDFAWIAGHWKGEAFGGTVEEMWAPPLGESMMGSFKLVNEGKTSFYEIEVLREIDDTVILQLKHFHGDLKGWEEKDETVDFRLVKLEENRAYFDGFTFHKISEDELIMYVVVSDSGKNQEVKFHYRRVKE